MYNQGDNKLVLVAVSWAIHMTGCSEALIFPMAMEKNFFFLSADVLSAQFNFIYLFLCRSSENSISLVQAESIQVEVNNSNLLVVFCCPCPHIYC